MNRFCIPVSVAAGFLALSWLSDATAERVSSHLPEALLTCIDESDDALRLACYDREMAALTPRAGSVSVPEPGEVASSDAKQVSEAQPVAPALSQAPDAAQVSGRSEVEEFGMTRELNVPEKKELMALTATVVEVSKAHTHQLAISLDNGQIWWQKYSGNFIVRVGDEVTIKKGGMGGYSLVRKGRRIAVKRIQ